MVDYATRYPKATALRSIEAETTAEPFATMFTCVGIPEEILSDQGSQFVSGVMKEVGRLLSISQLHTTVYHPMCNGLVERFNGTPCCVVCEQRGSKTGIDTYLHCCLLTGKCHKKVLISHHLNYLWSVSTWSREYYKGDVDETDCRSGC